MARDVPIAAKSTVASTTRRRSEFLVTIRLTPSQATTRRAAVKAGPGPPALACSGLPVDDRDQLRTYSEGRLPQAGRVLDHESHSPGLAHLEPELEAAAGADLTAHLLARPLPANGIQRQHLAGNRGLDPAAQHHLLRRRVVAHLLRGEPARKAVAGAARGRRRGRRGRGRSGRGRALGERRCCPEREQHDHGDGQRARIHRRHYAMGGG